MNKSVLQAISACTAGILLLSGAQAADFIPLGDLPGGGLNSSAADVSADGSVVVGSGAGASGGEAFRWTSATGMVGLGDLPGDKVSSTAESVSADGNVVVGRSESGLEQIQEAFVWTQANGMQRLFDILVANGVTGLDGWELRDAKGISADGQWIAGTGINPSGFQEAYLANISADPDADADFGVISVILKLILDDDSEQASENGN